MFVCNAAREKCPKVADFFLNIDENNKCFRSCEQKLSSRHFLCPGLCHRAVVFLPWSFCHGGDTKAERVFYT